MSAKAQYQVEVSAAEISALIKYHCSVTRRVTKAAGQEMLKVRADIMPRSRQLQIIHEEAKALVGFHLNRAKELQLILKRGGS